MGRGCSPELENPVAVTVDDDSGFSAAFLEELATLANRLLEHDLAIYEVSYNYLAFGSWTLVAGSRHRRLRFEYDGKEDQLDVSESTFSDSQSQPQWETLPPQTLEPGAGVNVPRLFTLVGNRVFETLGVG